MAATLRGVTDTPPAFVPYVPGPAPQPGPPETPTAPTSPPRRSHGGLIAAAVVAAALLLAGGGLGGAMLVSGKGPIDALKAAAGAGSFTASGVMVLSDSDGYSVSTTCSGKGGYADITEGASVTVTDAAGATIAVGRLGAGHLETAGCTFDFSIPDVPSGKGFYGIEVEHRGTLKYSEADISKGGLKMGLG